MSSRAQPHVVRWYERRPLNILASKPALVEVRCEYAAPSKAVANRMAQVLLATPGVMTLAVYPDYRVD